MPEGRGMIVPVTEENLMDAARVHAAAWRESHRDICTPEFVAAHTARRQADYLRRERAAGKELWLLLSPGPVGIVSTWGDLIENLYVLPERQGLGGVHHGRPAHPVGAQQQPIRLRLVPPGGLPAHRRGKAPVRGTT